MHVSPGTYVITIVPKSGWPVLGQTAVNSGQVISISYSRSGNWFGKVSSALAIGQAPPFGRNPFRRTFLRPFPGPEPQPPRLRHFPDDSTRRRDGWRDQSPADQRSRLV